MSALIVIPARFASTRYPGKPLVELTGADGTKRSLIERSWRAAMAVKGVDKVVVATDDDRILETAESFGAEVVLTSESCANGTERCAQAYANLGANHNIVVNFQGDAPLTPPWFVEALIEGLKNTPTADVATPVLRCDGETLKSLLNDRKHGRVGGTTAVFGVDNNALYFSKEVIPYVAQNFDARDASPVFHHVGVYAYRPSALMAYPTWAAGKLEGFEGLEQLRFLERARPMMCVEVEALGAKFWELNNPEDVPLIEKMLRDMGQA